MYTEELNKRIEAQEKKDRYIAERCLREKILVKNGNKLGITATPITCKVDLKCEVPSTKFNVEIKERIKNIEWLKKNPVVELKVDKLRRMRNVTDEDTRLFYMVLLNNKYCLLFDLDNLDWENVRMDYWHIKKTQLDDDSEYEDVLTYFIPINQRCAICDCSQYFKNYKS